MNDMAKAYTAEQLKGKGLSDLRKIAKLLKINPSGKNIADLCREILKAQKVASTGKGTSADIDAKGRKAAPKKGKKAVDEDDEEDEDEEEDEDDEEDEKPAKKTAKKTAAKKTSKKKPSDDEDEEDDEDEDDDEEDSDDEDEEDDDSDEDDDEDEEEADDKFNEPNLIAYLVKLGKKAGVPVPASWLKKGKVAKSSKSKNAKKKAKDDDDGDDDDDDAPDLNLTPDELKGMNLTQLKELVGQIHREPEIKKASKGKKIDVNTSSPNELRKRIGAFLDKFAPADEEGQEESSCPSFLKDGAKVEVDIGKKTEKWVKGTVSSIDEDEETATIDLDDGEEVESPWEHIRRRDLRAKKR